MACISAYDPSCLACGLTAGHAAGSGSEAQVDAVGGRLRAIVSQAPMRPEEKLLNMPHSPKLRVSASCGLNKIIQSRFDRMHQLF